MSADLWSILDDLEDENWTVRDSARQRLAGLGSEAIPSLLKHLETGYTQERTRMVNTQFWGMDQETEERYTAVLVTPKEVAATLTRIVARTGQRLDADLLGCMLQPNVPRACRVAALRALPGSEDPKAIPALIQALGDSSGDLRQEAVAALAPFGSAAVQLLLDALAGAAASTQRAAIAQTLGPMRDARSLPALLALLDDPEPDVRLRAAQAVAAQGPAGADLLLGALGEGVRGTRRAVARGLQGVGKGHLAAAVIAALGGDTRPAARSGDPRVARALLRALGNPEERARAGAAAALAAMGEQGLADAVTAALRGDPAALAALRDPRAVEPLLAALRVCEPALRRAAAQALASMGPVAAAALDPLEDILECGDHDLRTRDLARGAQRAIRAALRDAPAELEASRAPAGRGSELEAAPAPAGRGSEPEAAVSPKECDPERRKPEEWQAGERRAARLTRAKWQFWRGD